MTKCKNKDTCKGFTFDANQGTCQLKRKKLPSQRKDKQNVHTWFKFV